MKPVENRQILLKSRPEGMVSAENFESNTQTIAEVPEGKVLVRNIYLSIDPAMRGWMSDQKSYMPPVGIGEVMRGMSVGEVVESSAPSVKAGQLVSGMLGWQQYALAKPAHLTPLLPGVSLTDAISVLGITGLSAYFGLLEVGLPKEGETVLISGAAGGVGSVVGQIAKIKGCRVVGVAGSPEKCLRLNEELGFDAAINYREANLAVQVRAACPKGIDVFFDNVGGEILDVALANIRKHARIVLCGAISRYNETELPPGPRNYMSLIINSARMEGFILMNYAAKFPQAMKELGAWVAEGSIKSAVDIVDGLDRAPEALLRLFSGANQGKQLVKVGEEPA